MTDTINKLFWMGVTESSNEFIRELEKDFILRFSGECASCSEIYKFDPSVIIFEESLLSNCCTFCKMIQGSKKYRHIPLIYITGSFNRQKKLQLLQQGVFYIAHKPLVALELKLIINNIITSRRFYTDKLLNINADDSATADPFYKKSLEVINHHLDDPDFSCERLADKMCVSRITLYRKIKKSCQKSPIELIHHIRLHKAKEKLKTGEGNIKQVAYSVGFNSINYFTSLFKREFGVNPSVVERKLTFVL